MMTQSKSKTFYKGEDFSEVLEWFVKEGNIETDDYTPEGTNWSQGEMSPCDPRSDLKFKYVVTITKVLASQEDNSDSNETK